MTFSFNDAYRLINNVVSEKVSQMIKSGAGIEVGWGTIASLDGENMYSVYLYGDTIASSGFRAENGQVFQLGQAVRISIDRRGNRWIDANLSADAGSVSNIDPIAVTATGPSYPVGLSYFPATLADGWPVDVSFVKTFKYNDYRMHQEVTRHVTGEVYERMYHETGGGWNAFRQTSHRLRYVPIAEHTVHSSATDASAANTEVAKTVEATALPSNLANMYATGRLMVKHSAAPVVFGHYIRVNHWGGTMAGVAYAINPTQWTPSFYIAKTGGTNGRQLATLVHPGNSGTLTFHQTVTGYFTDDT